MIKEKIYYYPVCDKCGREMPVEATSKRVATDLAEANGWATIITDHNGAEKHLCPKCRSAQKSWYYGG